MAISTSPRKVPLRGGDDHEARPRTYSINSTSSVTKRAFFCGVVVEGPNEGRELSEDVQDLVASLGDRLSSDVIGSEVSDPGISTADAARQAESNGPQTRKRAVTDHNTLSDLIDELVSTERSYVKRLRILKDSYADPLRSYARSKDTAIIPAYEAKILFGNIDQLVPVNEAFLHDLELMLASDGERIVGGVGDVALRHFRDLRAFECYKQYYVKREEAQAIFRREMAKKSSTGFAAFVERIKYSTSDTKNRVGLRELLMEPVQRIPRYTLLFRAMVKHMHPGHPQRAKLVEADEIASKVALAETDDHTKRAAMMYCLGTTIDGFPPGLISNSRQFIDSIDVEDVLSDGISSASTSSASINTSGQAVLHCSLFLFDDKLMIVKRPAEKSSRALTGLDDLEKFTNGAGFPRGAVKKNGMSCKGVVDVVDAVATDVNGTDIHLYLESPPQDQSDRWSGRPLRTLSIVHPPSPVNQDPIRTEADKRRFLENLWNVQARYRAKAGQSVVLCTDDCEVESRGGKVTLARTYFNIYQRTPFLKEPKKTKIVMHIDASGSADPIPFGMNAPPFVVVRVQPMAGELCRYTVTSSDADDEEEEDIVQTARVPGRMVQTIHQFGLFKFRTGNPSRPCTPTAGFRSRAHIFGLDVISRNLFNSRPGSTKGDIFGGAGFYNHSRSKTSISRSSTQTETTMTTASDSLLKFSGSHRSGSTAATSAYASSSFTEEDSFLDRSISRSKKLVKRSKSKSPGRAGSGNESENSSPRRSRSRSVSVDRELDYSDGESHSGMKLDPSEMDLTLRLELARQNSKNQHDPTASSMEAPVEETIYEEEPPPPIRQPSLRRERERASIRSTTPTRPGSTTPTRGLEDESPRKGRRVSQSSRERRPLGPRPTSPLPPTTPEMPSMEIEMALETTLVNMGHTPATPAHGEVEGGGPDKRLGLRIDCGVSDLLQSESASPLPRSRRQPFEPTGNTGVTPKSLLGCGNAASSVANENASDGSPTKTGVEPLSIKKKTSTNGRSTATTTRNSSSRESPSSKHSSKASKRASLVMKPDASAAVAVIREINCHASRGDNGDVQESELPEKLLQLAEATREDIESSRRAVKRIRLEVSSASAKANDDDAGMRLPWAAGVRTPQRSSVVVTNAPTKEALQRMEEMRQLIGQRGAEATAPAGVASPRSRPRSVVATTSIPKDLHSPEPPDWTKAVVESIDVAERELTRATGNQENLLANLESLAADLKEKHLTLEKTRGELRGAKRQCDLVKNLLADATAENEIMYEAFNEELDGMFNDANLPEEEAWVAMTQDLRHTKERRNALTQENGHLKRRLQEAEMQRDEWRDILRAHGLIP